MPKTLREVRIERIKELNRDGHRDEANELFCETVAILNLRGKEITELAVECHYSVARNVRAITTDSQK